MQIWIDGQSYDTMVYIELRDLLTKVLEERSAGEFLMLSGLIIASMEYATPSTQERADAAQTLERWRVYFQSRYTRDQSGYHVGAGMISDWARVWLDDDAAMVIESEAIGEANLSDGRSMRDEEPGDDQPAPALPVGKSLKCKNVLKRGIPCRSGLKPRSRGVNPLLQGGG